MQKSLLINFVVVLLLYLFYSFFGVVSAQSNFKPGYIITTDGDTVTGYIDMKGEMRNSRICSFKLEKDSEVTDYKPFEILSYRFTPEGKFYVSSLIKNEKEGETKIFLEYLLNGSVDLYYYRQYDKTHFLIKREGGKLIELHNDKVQKDIGSKTYEYDSKQYVGVLKTMFSDVPELNKQIDKLNFSRRQIVGITKEYHDITCKNEECIVYEKKPPALKFSLVPYISYSFSFPTIAGAEFFELCNYNYSRRSGGGLMIDLHSPRVNERIFARLGISAGRADYFGSYEDEIEEGKYYEGSLAASGYSIMAGVGYTVPTGNVRPTFSAGYRLSKNTMDLDISLFSFNDSKVERENSELEFSEWSENFFLQAGAKYFFSARFALVILGDVNLPVTPINAPVCRFLDIGFKAGISYRL